MLLSTQTQNMLRLLSQIIIADGHILASEIEALVSTVQDLNLLDSSDLPLRGPQVRNWFASYSDELKETWTKDSRDVALTRLILSLADWPNKKAVVSALEKIGKADAEFHHQEKLLISIVKTYWQYDGLDAPDATIGV